MDYFEKFVSDTLAGSSNQFLFEQESALQMGMGRVYYKLFAGGKKEYSFLFTNVLDSTYSDGSLSGCNQILGEWQILGLRAGICEEAFMDRVTEPESFVDITFSGEQEKMVRPGEIFTTDPVCLDACEGAYLCLEIVWQGKQFPCHAEIQVPVFVRKDGEWIPSPKLPVPGMIGCKREVKLRIGFLGDSITQGIGATPNSYLHWNARVAEVLGRDYSFWNLGIGYGRAHDAASDGIWLSKAKQMDLIVLCMGVNDLFQRRQPEILKKDLAFLVDTLQKNGVKVILQSIPPFFDFDEQLAEMWADVNAYIRKDLSRRADGFFDVAPLLGDGPKSVHVPKYGGHPGDAGCKVWADGLAEYMKDFLCY